MADANDLSVILELSRTQAPQDPLGERASPTLHVVTGEEGHAGEGSEALPP